MTGNHHFYIQFVKYIVPTEEEVSMPYDGQSSFLLLGEPIEEGYFRCQCPMTGNHHFYKEESQ